MTLTATSTATQIVFKEVVKGLSLSDHVKAVSTPPNQKNLTLLVKPFETSSEFVTNVSAEIRKLRVRYSKTIIFHQNYDDCFQVYGKLEHLMGDDFTESPAYPNFHQFCLIEMHTHTCTIEMCKKVQTSIRKENSKLQLLLQHCLWELTAQTNSK